MAKILAVDDELEVLSLLESFLTKKGFEFLECNSGEKALDIIDRDKSIDLIILDHRMPKLDGCAVLKELKRKKVNIPVIMLTGSIGVANRYLEVDAFLMKPVNLDKVLEKINELLGRQ